MPGPGPGLIPGKRGRVIKFNMKDDEDARKKRRKVQDIAKVIREAGLPIRCMIGIDRPDVRKEFAKNKLTNNYYILEFSPMDEDKLGEVKDFITISTRALVVDSMDHNYSDGSSSHRILVDLSRIP